MDDLISTESAVVAAATAAVFSPKTRETMRRGAVLGVAGALKMGDIVTGAARGVVRGVRGEAAETGSTGAGEVRAVSPPPSSPSSAPRSPRASSASGRSTTRSAAASS